MQIIPAMFVLTKLCVFALSVFALGSRRLENWDANKSYLNACSLTLHSVFTGVRLTLAHDMKFGQFSQFKLTV